MTPNRVKIVLIGIVSVLLLVSCGKRESKLEQYQARKHERDSIGLANQEQSLRFYQSQLDSLLPIADSLIAQFRYEKNEKYQDHGYYVQTGRDGLRVLVRDDGQEPILMYRNGQRVEEEPILMYRNGQRVEEQSGETVERAEHLAVVMRDIKELEKRIVRTSFEIQKYQKRLQKE